MKNLIMSLIVLVLSIASMVISPWIFKTSWNWFMPTLWNLPILTYWPAFVLLFFKSMLFAKIDDYVPKEDKDDDYYEWFKALYRFLYMWLWFLISYILKLIIFK